MLDTPFGDCVRIRVLAWRLQRRYPLKLLKLNTFINCIFRKLEFKKGPENTDRKFSVKGGVDP